MDLLEQRPHPVIGTADEEARVDIRQTRRFSLEKNIRPAGLQVGFQILGFEFDNSNIHIRPNHDFPLILVERLQDQNQFPSDAAEKLRTEEIAGAVFLDEGRVEFEAFGHRAGEDIFEKHPVGRGVAAEEVHLVVMHIEQMPKLHKAAENSD